MPSAKAFLHYITTTVQSRELFQCIAVNPSRWWNCLIFMDSANFGGLLSSNNQIQPRKENVEKNPMPQSSDHSDSDEEFQLDAQREVLENKDQTEPEILSNWNIGEYLPGTEQDYFLIVIAEFVLEPWKWQICNTNGEKFHLLLIYVYIYYFKFFNIILLPLFFFFYLPR